MKEGAEGEEGEGVLDDTDQECFEVVIMNNIPQFSYP